MEIVELTAQDEGDWDVYVRASGNATPYHLLAWREVMAGTYGYRPHYLLAKRSGAVHGVLPLFEVRSRLIGDGLMSLPGGVCADTDEAGQALVEAARESTRTLGLDYLNLRDVPTPLGGATQTINHHCCFVREIPEAYAELTRTVPANMRRQVRQGLTQGARIEAGQAGLEDFYQAFATFTRDMGTPVFGLDFLKRIVRALPDRWMVVCIRASGRVIGGGFQLLLGDTIWGLWGGAIHRYLPLRPNHLLIWGCLEYGQQHGFRRLNLGRSRVGSGQYDFKRQWGVAVQPLYQQFYRSRNAEGGMRIDGADNARSSILLVRLWRHLPVSAARWLGPKIRRHIPFG